ncbi:hypothetical protein [Nonomuraea sp. JJY05]|uniref:hypothetical protein n=1 Tax=Nonomuraea sp. JJY05 TaxID=3350255 RepID=UPI00373E81CD
MQWKTRTLGMLAAVGAVMAGTLVYGPAASAAGPPSPCIAPATSNLDGGYGVMKGSFNLKKGPYADRCGNVTRLGRGRVIYFHCWTRNGRGNLWVYGRVKGTGTYGWMSVDNFRSIRHSNYETCRPNADRDHT